VIGHAQFTPTRPSDGARAPLAPETGGSLTDFVNQVRKAP
jgi:hypothetical protein